MLISSNTPHSIAHVRTCVDQKMAELLKGAKEQDKITLDVTDLKITTTVLKTFKKNPFLSWPAALTYKLPKSQDQEVSIQRGKRKRVYNPGGTAPNSIAQSFEEVFPIRKLAKLSKDELVSNLMKQVESTAPYTLESINFKAELLDSTKTVQNLFSPPELSFNPKAVICCAIERLESS